MINTSQDKFRPTVKKALIDRGQTITALAKEIGIARNTVSRAINHTIYPTVRQRIATKLNLSFK